MDHCPLLMRLCKELNGKYTDYGFICDCSLPPQKQDVGELLIRHFTYLPEFENLFPRFTVFITSKKLSIPYSLKDKIEETVHRLTSERCTIAYHAFNMYEVLCSSDVPPALTHYFILRNIRSTIDSLYRDFSKSVSYIKSLNTLYVV